MGCALLVEPPQFAEIGSERAEGQGRAVRCFWILAHIFLQTNMPLRDRVGQRSRDWDGKQARGQQTVGPKT